MDSALAMLVETSPSVLMGLGAITTETGYMALTTPRRDSLVRMAGVTSTDTPLNRRS